MGPFPLIYLCLLSQVLTLALEENPLLYELAALWVWLGADSAAPPDLVLVAEKAI
jgi:hypothetical protein